MNGADLQRHLDRLELSQVAFAEALGKDGRTVRRWISDELPVPRYAELALEALAHRRSIPATAAP